MRICYWSSEVSSSDLVVSGAAQPLQRFHIVLESLAIVGRHRRQIHRGSGAYAPATGPVIFEILPISVIHIIAVHRSHAGGGRLVAHRAGTRIGDLRDKQSPFRILVAGRHQVDVHVERSRSEEHTSELQSLMRITYAV